MKKMEQLYEGKAKKVFATDDPDVVIVDYKDDATAFNGEKKGTIVGKGVINNRMTNHVFKLLEKEGVPTHTIVRCENGKLKAKYGDRDVELLHCGGTVFAAVADGNPKRRISTFKFFLREGKAWAVRCYTRFYQRVE